MKQLLIVLSCIAACLLYGQNTFSYTTDFDTILKRTKISTDQLYYEKLLPRFQKNDTSLTDFEVLALMIGFTDKPDYKPYQDINTEREIYVYNDDRKYTLALSFARNFLQTHPLNVKVLYEVSYSFNQLNQKDSANYYLYRARKILKAMQFSGSGTTAQSPIFALGPSDGQTYILKHLGAKIGTMGSGTDEHGNFLDMLEAEFDANQEAVTYYFIIQHATAKMFDRKQLQEKLENSGKKE
jgi:hypothetical protein